MPDKTWKATERAVAARLGGVRTGHTGRNSPDVVSDWLCVEVKCRKRLPDWLLDAVAQARANTWGDRLPLVVLHQTGTRHDQDLVVLTLRDFEDWWGRLEAPEGEEVTQSGRP